MNRRFTILACAFKIILIATIVLVFAHELAEVLGLH